MTHCSNLVAVGHQHRQHTNRGTRGRGAPLALVSRSNRHGAVGVGAAPTFGVQKFKPQCYFRREETSFVLREVSSQAIPERHGNGNSNSTSIMLKNVAYAIPTMGLEGCAS